MSLRTALISAAAIIASPAVALACGGFFRTTTPVDQNAERILFEINDDGTVSTTVEISYSGDPEGFSWVVPVPDTPILEAVPQSALQLLDLATRVQIVSPPTNCNRGFNLFGGMMSASGGSAEDGGVSVEELPRVGPFDPEVISGTDAAELIDWLNTNGYTITAEMEPFMKDYVSDGMKFLVMKLAPDAATTDISPVRMTYPASFPMIPLVLTAVAAEPEMGVLVFIAGEGRYRSSNYANIVVPTELVQMNPANGQNNYQSLVSRLIDQQGGEAFITELADATNTIVPSNIFGTAPDWEDATAFNQEMLSRHSYITRLYTRISAWEINEDPGFEQSSSGNVSRVHDLSDRPTVEVCGSRPPRVECGDTYCGVGSTCASTEAGFDGCVCADGTFARSITDPVRGANAAVACQDVSFDLMQSIMPTTASLESDPCAGVSCGGNGTCYPVNGFPTCECDADFAAVAAPSVAGGLRCTSVTALYGVDQLTEWNQGGCSAVGADASLALTVLALLGWRRRKRVS